MTAYATTADLALMGIPSVALTSVTTTVQTAILLAASNFCDGYLASQYDLPLTAWGQDLTEAVCHIAAYKLMVKRGFNAESNAAFRQNFEDSLAWLKQISEGKVSPFEIVDSTPSTPHAGMPIVYSGTTDDETGEAIPSRGW